MDVVLLASWGPLAIAARTSTWPKSEGGDPYLGVQFWCGLVHGFGRTSFRVFVSG